MRRRILTIFTMMAVILAIFIYSARTNSAQNSPVPISPSQTASGQDKDNTRTPAVRPDTLMPDTVGSSNEKTAANSMESTSQPAPRPVDESFRFVVLADSRGVDKGVNSKVVKKIMTRLTQLSPQPEFAVMPGDLIDGAKSYDETISQLKYFKSIVTQFFPADFFYPGIGNHEMRTGSKGENAFKEVFSEFKGEFLEGYNKTVYYFDHKNTRLFMLNSNHTGELHTISDKQLNWINKNIDASKQHNLFFVHEPPFPTGSHVGSSLDANRLQRDKLWQTIDNLKGSMIFCGHEHNYTRRHIDSSFSQKVGGTEFKYNNLIYQLTVGSFGAPLYTEYSSKKGVDVPPVPQYHFAVVDIDGSKIKVKVYNIDGGIIDEFEQ